MFRTFAVSVIVACATIAAAQPTDNAPPLPSVEDIRNALGLPIESPKVRVVACAFRGTDPTVHMPIWHRPPNELNVRDGYTRYEWKTKGFTMGFDREEMAGAEWELSCIWMYDQGIRGFSRYKGELPKGVAFGASRVQVEMEYGAPAFVIPSANTEPGLAGGKITHTLFKKKGVAVSYLEVKGKEPVVAAVGLFTPGEAPHWW